ncbi:MAG TPA: hypothetical protein VIL16_14480, partial [Trebonia sp.]
MSAPASTRPAPDEAPEDPLDGPEAGPAGWMQTYGYARPQFVDRLEAWVRAHRTVLLSLGIPLLLVIAATAWNLQGWPGRADEDEGTYVAEAWAII